MGILYLLDQLIVRILQLLDHRRMRRRLLSIEERNRADERRYDAHDDCEEDSGIYGNIAGCTGYRLLHIHGRREQRCP